MRSIKILVWDGGWDKINKIWDGGWDQILMRLFVFFQLLRDEINLIIGNKDVMVGIRGWRW